MLRRTLHWVLVVVPAFIFVQSLFFKFSGSQETVIIFNTIGDWMAGLPVLSTVAAPFAMFGGTVVGMVELVAAIMLPIPRTRIWGALTGLTVISGLIFFHLFTPLGVNRIVDAAGNTDGGAPFIMACIVWLCCAATTYLNRDRLPLFSRAIPVPA